VLPPNDIEKITDWWCLAFQSVANVPDDAVSLPYASYTLLYAARFSTGELVFLQELAPLAVGEPLAADEHPAATRANVAPIAAAASRERLLIRPPNPTAQQWANLIKSIELMGI
jgi:hypothetical protein